MKVKDRPFTKGSRGCHALLWMDAQNLNAKERHIILPLVIWTFIVQSVEAEVVMRFYGWMHKILMRKNITLYCHL